MEKNRSGPTTSYATIKISVANDEEITAAEGDGPVNALDNALRKALNKFYPQVEEMRLVDFKVRLVDGSFHTVDSSDMAFRIAGSMALKNALAGARPVLLEPMMRLEVVVPDEMLGEVIADLTSRRGKIFGMEPTSKGTLIHAQAPHAELRTYAPELRSLTKGLGYFTMDILGYEEVPTHEAQKVLAQRAAEQGKEEPKPNQPGKGRA